MIKFFGKLLINTLAVLLTAELLPGIHVQDPLTALLAALVLSLLNVTVKPVLIFLTIPFTVLTFGLFLLVINAVIIIIAGKLISGFEVTGFWWALLFSIVLALINSILEHFILSVSEKRPD
ncbi:MAG: membrane protein [Chitinophagales bacterium]|nr:MAG: membrane protein [Chitinophagales bacterium]